MYYLTLVFCLALCCDYLLLKCLDTSIKVKDPSQFPVFASASCYLIVIDSNMDDGRLPAVNRSSLNDIIQWVSLVYSSTLRFLVRFYLPIKAVTPYNLKVFLCQINQLYSSSIMVITQSSRRWEVVQVSEALSGHPSIRTHSDSQARLSVCRSGSGRSPVDS